MMRNKNVQIHPSSEVASTRRGAGTLVWQYCVIFKGAVIGVDCSHDRV